MDVLAPYRERIDEVDAEILNALALRFSIVHDVAQVKRREGIPAVLPERVEEVKARAARAGERLGLNRDFVGALYALIVDEACRIEERLIGD